MIFSEKIYMNWAMGVGGISFLQKTGCQLLTGQDNMELDFHDQRPSCVREGQNVKV